VYAAAFVCRAATRAREASHSSTPINAITGGDSDRATLPPLWHLLALVAGTVSVVA
jgi:hypothetical protein